jgi:cation:H+ antiporter
LEISALVAVLPEYAVDFVFAWRGGNAVQADGSCQDGDQNPCALAGPGQYDRSQPAPDRDRLGAGGPAGLHPPPAGTARRRVRLSQSGSVEVIYLALATRYSLTLPLKRTVILADTVVLVAIFVAYSNLRPKGCSTSGRHRPVTARALPPSLDIR